MFTYLRRASACIFMLLALLLLAACGGSTATVVKATPTPSPSPTPDPGQHLLAQVAHTLGTASTLHAIFDITISGASFKGRVKTEIWNAAPNKNRTVVLDSSLAQYPTGTLSVSDGKQVWVYDPGKNVAYHGPVTTGGAPGSGGLFGGGGSGQSQLILNLVQTIFTNSKATLVSSAASAHGHSAYEVHVVPGTGSATPGGSGLNNLNYDGDIFIDKATSLPVLVNLALQGFAQVQLDIPSLILNQPIPAGTFTFVVPPGAKVRPLVQASPTSDTGATTLAQAQQQAGYHLLSIPASQTAYQLVNVNVLGAAGNLVFTLNYSRGGKSFSIIEARSLANVPASGQQIGLRGTSATFSTAGGAPILAWTENGVGLRITGSLSEDGAVTIAKLLS